MSRDALSSGADSGAGVRRTHRWHGGACALDHAAQLVVAAGPSREHAGAPGEAGAGEIFVSGRTREKRVGLVKKTRDGDFESRSWGGQGLLEDADELGDHAELIAFLHFPGLVFGVQRLQADHFVLPGVIAGGGLLAAIPLHCVAPAAGL